MHCNFSVDEAEGPNPVGLKLTNNLLGKNKAIQSLTYAGTIVTKLSQHCNFSADEGSEWAFSKTASAVFADSPALTGLDWVWRHHCNFSVYEAEGPDPAYLDETSGYSNSGVFSNNMIPAFL